MSWAFRPTFVTAWRIGDEANRRTYYLDNGRWRRPRPWKHHVAGRYRRRKRP